MKTILRASIVCLLFAGSALALTGERMTQIPLEKMSPAQRSVADAIMSGPRKGMNGPFNAWLRSPELADRLQKVGEYVRFNSSLDKRLNEMAIIMTGRPGVRNMSGMRMRRWRSRPGSILPSSRRSAPGESPTT
jgi:4-carboxymuconolactone decarboxylase